MEETFDISKFDSYRENNCLEVKKAKGGLPNDMWETYSAFANTNGGYIVLGVKELTDRSWKTTGLKAGEKGNLLDNLWNLLHNKQKINECLMTERNIKTYEVGEDLIIAIYVPRAAREQKPIYINGDMFEGTFRRDNTGDYHCTRAQVKAMLRDQTEKTMDMNVLAEVALDDLNYETVHAYRNSHRALKPGHPFERLDDNEYLRSIGAAAISSEDKKLHPTAAGLLMFGDEYNIVRQFPEYFLDYREMLDPTTRWTDRIQSSSGEWTGNLFDFYYRVYNKITKDIKVPFKTENGIRVDNTPVHDALREALANCLVNADYFGVRGVVIKKEVDKLVFENPGYIITGKKQMLLGGISDPRNKALLKMFNLVDVGERAGSGVPNIFNAWADEGWVEPIIEEQFDPDRTILTLEFKKKQVKKATEKSDRKKATEKSDRKKVTKKTQAQIDAIFEHMEEGKWYKAGEFVDVLGVKETRTKEILRLMVELGKLETDKATKGKSYSKVLQIKRE